VDRAAAYVWLARSVSAVLRGSATTHRRADKRRADARALALGERELGVHDQREQRRGRERLDELAARNGACRQVLRAEMGGALRL
jgi:hypothetical protein